MRAFTDGNELEDLIEGNVEPIAESLDIRYDEPRCRPLREGNAHIRRPQGFGGEGGQCAPNLSGEHHG